MEWQDEGTILELLPYGERAFLVQILTSSHGRHLGMWRGSGQRSSTFQPGSRVKATWKARLETQVGLWILEPLPCPDFFIILQRSLPLLGLMTLNALCRKTLPERHPYPEIYAAYLKAFQKLATPHPATALVFFELTLLKELGYGLCLDVCTVTGETQNLTHVSPVSGKAVCATVAQPYKERLLPLPPFLGKKEAPALLHLQQAFRLTEVFLSKHLFDKSRLPEIRRTYLARLYSKYPNFF